MNKRKTDLILNVFLTALVLIILLWFLLNLPTITEEFSRAIIESRAYIGLWKGLRVTLLLSLLGVALGTLFGAAFCALRMSEITAFRLSGRLLVEVLRGTPVVMLLMFLYFFVFRGSTIAAFYVAALGFGLNTGAHMAEIFRTSIEAINPKEIEAARMLGFSRVKAFLYITLPQSWSIARPVYESSIISLLQWTTVAGYISVTELTRIINGLGSRTGDPFYSLFLGIVIYLGLAYVIRLFFWLGNKRGESR